jgi:phenylacetate-coenzyme A ligase PaaK-like adenylate-forming protein
VEPDALIRLPQFSLTTLEKDGLLLDALNRLTKHHRHHSPEYARLLEVFGMDAEAQRLEDVPSIPVSVFKDHAVKSISDAQVFKVLTSSGTTSSRVSRIALDRETAQRQTQALASIMSFELGAQRLPMIVVDTKDVIKDRKSFSARGAGVVGMSTFGRDHFHALTNEMELDREGLLNYLAKHSGERLFVFGFTFMIWKYFAQLLRPGEIDLSQAVLVHGGGWKKLADEAVSPAEFKRELEERTGLRRCLSFYGMVEQVGSAFLECDQGYLHAPNFADAIIRDPNTWQPAKPRQHGVVQVLSVLPTSYPGHSLLTEDIGELVADDHCLCGRRGRHFLVHGRVPAAEIRGCSDTHEQVRRGGA